MSIISSKNDKRFSHLGVGYNLFTDANGKLHTNGSDCDADRLSFTSVAFAGFAICWIVEIPAFVASTFCFYSSNFGFSFFIGYYFEEKAGNKIEKQFLVYFD